MKKIILIIFFIISISYLFSNPLTEFVSYMNENGSIKFDLDTKIHVKDIESDSSTLTYIDEEIRLNFFMSDWKNFFCKFESPDILSGISFVYLSDEAILFSLVNDIPWRQYRIDSNIELILNILNNFLWELFNEAFYTSEEVVSDGVTTYIFTPSKAKSALNNLFSGGYLPDYMYFKIELSTENIPILKEITISEKSQIEYIKLKFSNLQFSSEKDYFEKMKELYYDTF
ncbi:MAG: hypothetical protein PWQ77_909 [Kosmotogales bacterium]|nr:hypothetical protein [Kosmotogales bacterium]